MSQNTSMHIRPIKKSEVKFAAQIVGRNYSSQYEKSSSLEIMAMFTNSVIPPKYVVAEDKGKIIGFAGYTQSWMDYSAYNLFWVNVTPASQGQGIGKRLVEDVIDRIRKIKDKENPPELILLTATKDNTDFYKQFDFEVLTKFAKGSYNLMGLHLK